MELQVNIFILYISVPDIWTLNFVKILQILVKSLDS